MTRLMRLVGLLGLQALVPEARPLLAQAPASDSIAPLVTSLGYRYQVIGLAMSSQQGWHSLAFYSDSAIRTYEHVDHRTEREAATFRRPDLLPLARAALETGAANLPRYDDPLYDTPVLTSWFVFDSLRIEAVIGLVGFNERAPLERRSLRFKALLDSVAATLVWVRAD